MADYRAIIEAVIAKQIDLTNRELAIRQARKVPDLRVEDEGQVEAIDGPGKRVLSEVVSAYSEIMGEVAESILAYMIRDSFDVDPDDLPENLSSHL
jgi:hypothetical protein